MENGKSLIFALLLFLKEQLLFLSLFLKEQKSDRSFEKSKKGAIAHSLF